MFIEINNNQIYFGIEIYDASATENSFKQILQAYYPNAKMENISSFGLTYPIFTRTLFMERKQSTDAVQLPITKVQYRNDPLQATIQSLRLAQEGEILRYVIRILGIDKWWWHGKKQGFNLVMDIFNKFDNPVAYNQTVDQRREYKKSQQLYNCLIYFQMFTRNTSRFKVLNSLSSTLKNMADPNYPVFDNFVTYDKKSPNSDELLNVIYGSLSEKDENKVKGLIYQLMITELATLWHLPHSGITVDKLLHVTVNKSALPDKLKGIRGIAIGKNDTDITTLPTDDRTSHTMIIGKTGTGKTTTMHRMITHDIASGHGVMVIDPKGSLIEAIVKHSIPDNRIDDVVLLDFGLEINNRRYPPPFNPLYKITDGIDVRLAPDLVTVMNRVYDDFEASQMGDLLEIVLQFLAVEDKPILRDIRRFLRDDAYRLKIQNKSYNPALMEDWEDIEEDWKMVKKQSYRPLMRRLRSFYKDKQSMASTCHPNTLDVKRFVREKKIVLVNVSPKNNTLSDKERFVLGSMLVSQLFNMARRYPIKGNPFMLYIDETEQFRTMPLADMLVRAREYNIGLVLANQYLKQFVGKQQQAVEGSVGTMISFEIGLEDANIMRRYMNTFEAEDLMGLGKYKAGVSVRYDDERLSSFSVNTAIPYKSDLGQSALENRIERIKRASLRNLNLIRQDEIIKWIESKYQDDNDNSDEDDETTDGDDNEFIE